LSFSRLWFRPFDFNLLTGAGSVCGFDGTTIDANVSFLDEALDGAARDFGEFGAQVGIEAR